MTRTVITLKARWCGDPPQPGELMAAPAGSPIYRISSVVTLRQAGETPGAHRYRLTCTRLALAEVPQGAEIHPWRCDRRVRRPYRAPAVVRVPRMDSEPLKRSVSVSRNAHVPDHAAGDFGPALRRRDIKDHKGRLLRESDVEVSDDREGDPRYPNRRVRRARRVDSIDLLVRDGSIDDQQQRAANDLRKHLEHITPSMGSGGEIGMGRVAAWLCQPITAHHLDAVEKVRKASAALGEKLWHPVLWVCLGGSVRGYAAQWHVGTHRATDLVKDGLARLGDHFYGRTA